MRSRRTMRGSRTVHAAAGTLMLAVPASAVALAAAQADAQSAIQIDVSSGHVPLGRHVTVHGVAPSGNAGQRVLLEFARGGGTAWKPISSTQIGADGHFQFVTKLRQSGLLRAVPSSSTPTRSAVLGNTDAAGLGPSSPQQVSVRSAFQLRRRSIAILGSRAGELRGKLLPGIPDRRVRLEGGTGHGWRVLGSARTRSGGRFDIRFHPGSGASSARGEQLRVEFRGDRLNVGNGERAGKAIEFHQSLASWYDDAGTTGCGFHAGFGVANKTLPCGTRVTFHYSGRTVTAVVDDRGPYVGGREWDLNQNTAGALGFGGVGPVWATT